MLIIRDMRAVKIMMCRLTLCLRWLSSTVCTTAAVRLENLALRHQIAVYQQSIARPKLQPIDRLFWAWFSRLWAGWQQALEFVQPRTVLAWQRKRFRDHWRELSQRPKLGRPALSKEVRDLIQDMWRSNPTWGSPRGNRNRRCGSPVQYTEDPESDRQAALALEEVHHLPRR